jgi:hypothetical protein
MSWHQVVLTTAQAAQGELISLRDRFESLFFAAGAPKKMALFAGGTDEAGVVLYFSPGCLPDAADLISNYSGTPCEKPERIDELIDKATALVVGHPDAWDLLK